MNYLGSKTRNLGYANLSEIQHSGLLGYNLVFRILGPTVFISVVSMLLYQFRFDEFVKSIWLVVVWYVFLNITIVLFWGIFPLVNKVLYFTTHLATIGLSYWIYNSTLIRGIEFVLPDIASLRTEFWLIILFFFYYVLNNLSPDYNADYNRREEFIKGRYHKLRDRYYSVLTEPFKNDSFLEKTLFSIMIAEDINRPSFVRFFERILFPFNLVKSIGIMQVKFDKFLTNEESIKIAQQIILEAFGEYKDKTDHNRELFRNVASKYNKGNKYRVDVMEIFSIIDPERLLYKERSNKKYHDSPGNYGSFFEQMEIKDKKSMLVFIEKLSDEIKNIVREEIKKIEQSDNKPNKKSKK